MTILEKTISTYGQSVNLFINEIINNSSAPDILKQACLYSINAGGKRIRPALFLMVIEALGIKILNKHIAFASALEMIHTYSLIHDDLPSMDNDDYRRGKLTSHKKFSEAYAILAGDSLLNLAFETLLEYSDSKKDIKAALYIAKASGHEGMVGGQVMDMSTLRNTDEVLKMYSLKTGALFKASIMSASVMAGLGKRDLKKLENYADNIGIAFQLRDDFIDKTNINSNTGKPKNSDERNDKSTYISIKGFKANEKKLHKHTNNALRAIDTFGERFDMLRQMAIYLDDRDK